MLGIALLRWGETPVGVDLRSGLTPHPHPHPPHTHTPSTFFTSHQLSNPHDQAVLDARIPQSRVVLLIPSQPTHRHPAATAPPTPPPSPPLLEPRPPVCLSPRPPPAASHGPQCHALFTASSAISDSAPWTDYHHACFHPVAACHTLESRVLHPPF